MQNLQTTPKNSTIILYIPAADYLCSWKSVWHKKKKKLKKKQVFEYLVYYTWPKLQYYRRIPPDKVLVWIRKFCV